MEHNNMVQSSIQLTSVDNQWKVACSDQTGSSLEQFLEVTNLLLEQVQLNSTHLFRADILLDSTSELQTLTEKEANYIATRTVPAESVSADSDASAPEPPSFHGYQHQRTIVRRLIPRKPQLDRPLEQSCFIYRNTLQDEAAARIQKVLVVYQPHCQSEDEMPWYHPKVKSLAYLYSDQKEAPSIISVHYLPFRSSASPIPDRLERTFQSLLKTMLRLLTLPSKDKQPTELQSTDIATMPLTSAALKDSILPQHIVQDTYTMLKQKYASDLISRWIEKTEPSKHVFEDLSIAAFLIELWNTMYEKDKFPGFVDIACGNGVLVYILVKEGFKGTGFDARKRKTWEVLGLDDTLHEQVCIPKPFLDLCSDVDMLKSEMQVHDGIFPHYTFIISNHADELTCWTPILSVLSNSEAPLPFLAIPCCSHALDGSRRRYTLKDVIGSRNTSEGKDVNRQNEVIPEEQPATGDLKAMRAIKQKATADDKSMYACLTRKTASLAQEIGCEVELTLMRIPSTRNIGIVGNRKRGITTRTTNVITHNETSSCTAVTKVEAIVERECSITGGVVLSAQTWIEKARKLQGGQGRGKVNWNSHVKQSLTEPVT